MKPGFYLIFLISIVFALFIISCEETNNDPDTDPRAQYLGTWTCTEAATYSVVISLDPSNSSQILIKNFHMFGSNESAYAIATSNNLTLPYQTILNNTVNGSGTLINNNKINMKYYVNNQTDIDTINAVYTK